MDRPFKEYAGIYDIIYKNKDYESECEFLRKVFKIYSKTPVHSVLDIACGTGNHMIPLAKMGFKVSGQDMSKDMLGLAKSKCRKLGLKVEFFGCLPMQRFKTNEKFDAVIAMFASIGYLTSLKDLRTALKNIRDTLNTKGLFIFDCWNKKAVMKNFFPYRKKVFADDHRKVIRISETSLDKKRCIANINYSCIYSDGVSNLKRINEVHRMRYFEPQQIKGILSDCGFKTVSISPFMQLGREVTDKNWVISIVAVKDEK